MKKSASEISIMFLAAIRAGNDIKSVQRYYPMRGFANFASAARFCRAFDELCLYFRPRHMEKETLPLMQQRELFCERLLALQELMGAVS